MREAGKLEGGRRNRRKRWMGGNGMDKKNLGQKIVDEAQKKKKGEELKGTKQGCAGERSNVRQTAQAWGTAGNGKTRPAGSARGAAPGSGLGTCTRQ